MFPGDSSLVGALSAKRFSAWSAEDTTKIEPILARNQPAIELLERARGLKESNWEIPYEQGSAARLPNLLAAINAAKLLNARGRYALGRGQLETAVASAEALGALARSHEAEGATIVLVIGLAIEKLQIALVQEIVLSPVTTRAELDRVEASLCDEDLTRALRRSIRASASAIAIDFDPESALGDIDGVIQRRIARALGDVFAAAMIESYQNADRHLGEPIQAPLPRAEDGRENRWWKRLLADSGANLENVSTRATATASARELAHLALALRRIALDDGRYPAGLPAIEGVPVTDPLTGGPREYVVHGDGSAELRSRTSVEIVKSIAPASQLSYEALYVWELPAPR
jgi:hypothetical protein